MKLYGSVTSPYVRHCRVALAQGGIDFEFIHPDAATVAGKSPTNKVPFLVDGGRTLGDSCSIIRHARESADAPFFPDLDDYDLFCVTNTFLDSAINVFLLEKDGLTEQVSPYFGKQRRRITNGLDVLNGRVSQANYTLTDGILRLACFLDWGLFRNRFDIAGHENLVVLLDHARKNSFFAATAIPDDA